MRLSFACVLCLIFSVNAQQTESQRVPVQVAQPITEGLVEQLSVTGTLIARQDALLSSRTAGLVAGLQVDVGARVQQGDLLLELDTALAEHELAQRKAALQVTQVLQAERQRLVQEAETLTAQQLFPQTELALRRAAEAEAGAAVAQAQAALQQQQEVLQRHRLTAPFSGVIAERMTDTGEYLSLGTPVFRLVALAPLYLDVQLPQEYYPAMAHLTAIEVESDLYPSQTLSATLQAKVPVTAGNTRSFLARISLQDNQLQILPGTSAKAVLHFSRSEQQVLVIPADALLRHADGKFSVFSVVDGQAYRRLVKLGRNTPQGIEILSGLPAGEAVVVRGNENLRDAQPVRILQQAGE